MVINLELHPDQLPAITVHGPRLELSDRIRLPVKVNLHAIIIPHSHEKASTSSDFFLDVFELSKQLFLALK